MGTDTDLHGRICWRFLTIVGCWGRGSGRAWRISQVHGMKKFMSNVNSLAGRIYIWRGTFAAGVWGGGFVFGPCVGLGGEGGWGQGFGAGAWGSVGGGEKGGGIAGVRVGLGGVRWVCYVGW